MAPNQEILTPNPEAADLPNPADGTASSDGSGNSATNEAPPPDWEQRYRASTTEYQRLQNENRQREQAWLAEQARYNAELALLRQQQAGPAPEPQYSGSYMNDEETKAYNNAVIDQNTAEVQRLQSLALSRASERATQNAEARLMNKLSNASTTVARNQALAGYLQSLPAGATDPNSPVYARLNQKYEELRNSSRYAHLPRNEVNFGTSQAPNVVDVTFLTLAADKIEGEFRTAAPPMRQDGFTEPSNRSVSSGNRGFNANVHMTQDERDMCKATGMSYEDWQKYEPTTAERIRTGRPVERSRRDGEFVFRPAPRKR